MTHATITTDAEGTIVGCDAGAAALFGHAAENVLGRPVDLLVPEPLREAHWTGFRRAMRSPRVRDLAADLPVLCADGPSGRGPTPAQPTGWKRNRVCANRPFANASTFTGATSNTAADPPSS